MTRPSHARPQVLPSLELLEPRLFLANGAQEPLANPVTHIAPFGDAHVQDNGLAGSGSARDILGQPTSFDLRPSGKMTSVKDQGACGSCWAFATYGSLESSILMASGTATDLSENNLKNYHGFDWGPCDGGNAFISDAYLTRFSGPVAESADPYHAYDDTSTPPSGPTPPQYYVRDMLVFDTDAEIKNNLMSGGALYTTMYMNLSFFNSTSNTYYYNGTYGGNHAVTIAGWDDTKETAAATPGAWLIKNSWGISWGSDGYFWLSYSDSRGGNSACSFCNAVDPSTFKTVYCYDTLGDVNQLNTPYGMNAFTASSAEPLTAVNFWTQADNAGYSVKIYRTFTNGVLWNLAATKTGTLTYAGNHTVNLDWPVRLATGEKFYVVVNITNGGAYPMAFEYAVAGYSSLATAAAGQSYYSFNGTSWGDLWSWDATANLCIKALTGDATAPPVQDFYALSEATTSGKVSGSYRNTGDSDNKYEALTEILSAKKSILEHTWTFNLSGGTTRTFHVEAYKSGPEDNFKFQYSTNGRTWTDMLTVTKTIDDNTAQTYSMPSGLSGTVYVRVIDTNREANKKVLDTLYVDWMFIRCA